MNCEYYLIETDEILLFSECQEVVESETIMNDFYTHFAVEQYFIFTSRSSLKKDVARNSHTQRLQVRTKRRILKIEE